MTDDRVLRGMTHEHVSMRQVQGESASKVREHIKQGTANHCKWQHWSNPVSKHSREICRLTEEAANPCSVNDECHC